MPVGMGFGSLCLLSSCNQHYVLTVLQVLIDTSGLGAISVVRVVVVEVTSGVDIPNVVRVGAVSGAQTTVHSGTAIQPTPICSSTRLPVSLNI